MPEYGCRAYWKCIDGFSVGHCCSEDSAYVEGMGCLEDIPCFQSCPPEGGIAVRRKLYITKKKIKEDNQVLCHYVVYHQKKKLKKITRFCVISFGSSEKLRVYRKTMRRRRINAATGVQNVTLMFFL